MEEENKDGRELFEYPLNDNRSYIYNHSSGLRYEQDHVYQLLKQGKSTLNMSYIRGGLGKLESDAMSHANSLDVLSMLDEIRRQLNVEFPHDKK